MGLFDRILERFRGTPPRQDAPGLFTARSPGVPTDRSATVEDDAPPEDLWDRPEPTPGPEVVDPVEPDVTEPVVMEPGVLQPEDVASEDEPAEPIDPEAELAAIEELAPPAAEPETPVAPVWDEAAWIEAGATTELEQQVVGGEPSSGPVVEDEPREHEPREDEVAPAGSTADEPLFAAYETAPEPPLSEEPAPDPVPPLFDPPEVATEPEPGDVAPEVAAYVEPEPITPDPEPEPVVPDPGPTPVTPEPGPTPEPDPEPRGLVVETHPEVFDPAAREQATPATAPEAEVAPDGAAAERTMRVHDERLDKRPGPIRMTPSEAIRLAQDGPRATRRPDPPEA